MKKYKIVDFKKYSSIKIGPKIEVEIIDELKDLDSYIIGGANNLLVSNTPPKLCMLGKNFDYIKIENDRLIIGGATKSGKIFNFCKRNNIKGFEFLSKLPGTLGGLVKMNAGVKEYEIFNNLISIKTAKKEFLKKELDFGYRYCNIDSIIFEATFSIESGFSSDLVNRLNNLRKNQPSLPSAGSVFKNPPNNYAGKLIEEVGLKGARIGDASFSDIHANFLVNLNNATFKDSFALICEAKKRVKDKFGIILQEEIKILHKG